MCEDEDVDPKSGCPAAEPVEEPEVFAWPLLWRAALNPKSSSSVIMGMLGNVCCALLASQLKGTS